MKIPPKTKVNSPRTLKQEKKAGPDNLNHKEQGGEKKTKIVQYPDVKTEMKEK